MLTSGTKIGGFLIGELLGKGAMGEVYRGEQLSLKRPVAIKRIATHLLENEDMVKRFKREAQVLAKVGHPNVVGVIECEEFPGPDGALHLLLIMELIEGGRSLKSHVGKPLDWRLATTVIRMCADGLAAAFDQQVVHRDIKPDNIMMTRKGIAKLVDFGLAKAAESTALTMQSAPMGTPLFMSPEACRGEEIGHAGDLYSLGVTWFYMLSGRYPFQAANLHGLLYKHINDPVPNPMGLFDNVPEPIVKLCYQCLEKDPTKRPASAQKLVEAIEALPSQGLLLPRDARELLGAGNDKGQVGGGTTAATLVAGNASVDRAAATIVTRSEATVGADLSPQGAAAATVMANLSDTAAQQATRPTALPPSATANTIIAPSTAAANAATMVASPPAPAKSKAPLIIGAVVLLAIGGGAAAMFSDKPKPTDTATAPPTQAAAVAAAPAPKPVMTSLPTQQPTPISGQTGPISTEPTITAPADSTAAADAKRAAEAKRTEDEAKRVAEAKRTEDEAKRVAEAKRTEDEAKRVAEAKRTEDEAKRVAEAKRTEDEAKRVAAETKRAEEEAKRIADGIAVFDTALADKRWADAHKASGALPEPAKTNTSRRLVTAANAMVISVCKTAQGHFKNNDLRSASITLAKEHHGAIDFVDDATRTIWKNLALAVQNAIKTAKETE